VGPFVCRSSLTAILMPTVATEQAIGSAQRSVRTVGRSTHSGPNENAAGEWTPARQCALDVCAAPSRRVNLTSISRTRSTASNRCRDKPPRPAAARDGQLRRVR